MANMMDYLIWRSDLTLKQVPICPVDALILTTLSYLRLDGLVPEDPKQAPTLRETAQMFFELPEEIREARVRSPRDEELLERLGESRRFGGWRLCAVESVLEEQKEMQFAAMTLLTGNGCVFVAFRGTDGTLVGWKEDLNLSFMDTPGQWAAAAYLEKIAGQFPGGIYVGGHSKGGNLAVFAAAKCSLKVRSRIRAVYNHDGPGFRKAVLSEEGYQAVLDRVKTFVPQSSVVGMMLEHEEPYTVVRSSQSGLLQHEPYSWEVQGADFIRLRQVTEGSRMLDQTVKSWLEQMTGKEREAFADALYELLQASDVDHVGDLAQPRYIYAVLKKLGQEDGRTQRMLLKTIATFLEAAVHTLGSFPQRRAAEP